MKTVRVPDVRAPKNVCWKQQTDPNKPGIMERCTFKKGHTGPHQWESAQWQIRPTE